MKFITHFCRRRNVFIMPILLLLISNISLDNFNALPLTLLDPIQPTALPPPIFNISLDNFNATPLTLLDPIQSTAAPPPPSTTKSNADTEDVEIPAILIPYNGKLDVRCSRSFYCNPSKCRPIRMKEEALARHGYDEISSFLFQERNNSNSNRSNDAKRQRSFTRFSHSRLRIQYWGDSVQATLECDMRQWMHDASAGTKMTSEYVQLGCPWRKCTPEGGWKGLALRTQKDVDMIVFTIGNHYEFLPINDFKADLDRYYDILEPFLKGGGNYTRSRKRALLVLSPSPTHFDTPNGLFNETLRDRYPKNDTNFEFLCVPIPNGIMPSIITQQKEALKTFVNRLKKSMTESSAAAIVEYVDVHSLSLSRHQEHRGKTRPFIDCKHFCQNCGILRAWNALIVDKIMNVDPEGTIFQFDFD
jgi:hypothetical protein